MNKKIIGFCIVLFVFNVHLHAQEQISKSDAVKIDFAKLAINKKRVAQKDPALMPAYKQLIKDAEKIMLLKPTSVMDKVDTPPSGNKHDYMSIAPYWWPDPSKPNGVPYMRKDGQVTPETKLYSDKNNLPPLCDYVYTLSLAYYFSNDERYATKAATLTKVWFLDTATKMNPNMDFGQAVKGVATGRGEAMIDSRHFMFLLDGIQIIGKSAAWSQQDEQGLQQWFKQYLNWMHSSKNGLDELNANNNHGIWYDAQDICYSLYVHDTLNAKKALARNFKRLSEQQDEHGFFPLELARQTSMHYSTFILNAFQIIAQLADQLNADYWHQSIQNKSLEKAYQALLPYMTKEKAWDMGKQIKPFTFGNAYPILLRSYDKYGCKSCIDFINKDSEHAQKLLIQLL
jgi:hypothetical protein